MKTVIVLFGHGARDPRWADPFRALQAKIQAQSSDGVTVELAFLELMTPGLPEVISQGREAGAERMIVVPVFFGQGGHLRKDFPVLMEQCRAEYPGLTIDVTPPVGEWDDVLNCIAHGAISSINAFK